MERILAVQRMQDYIEAHLQEEITPAGLAEAAHFSPWYARRLFELHTGLAPARYIRRLRLAKSALQLRDEGKSVAEVAFAWGFGSVDGYQRAFRREFGCNPCSYARHPQPLPWFIPYGVKYRHTQEKADMKQEQMAKTVFVQLICKPARAALIRRGRKAESYFDYCEEVGCDLWGLLCSIPGTWGEPVGLWLPEQYRRPGTSRYVQGVEVPLDYEGTIPEGMERILLPEAEYLLFTGEPFAEEDYCEAIQQVQQAMDRYDPAVMGYAWELLQPRIQLEPRGERGYMELRAVKRK